jgi:ABC-type arginine transport system ATPase subunit
MSSEIKRPVRVDERTGVVLDAEGYCLVTGDQAHEEVACVNLAARAIELLRKFVPPPGQTSGLVDEARALLAEWDALTTRETTNALDEDLGQRIVSAVNKVTVK